MQTKQTPFSLAALGVVACSTPAASFIFFLAIALAQSAISHSFGSADVFLMIGTAAAFVTIVSVWGSPAALLFGAGGAFLAGRFLPLRPVWPWGLAGAATAGVYVLTSTGLGRVAPAVNFIIAPWVLLFEIGGPGGRGPDDAVSKAMIMCSIVLAGAVAGLVYRHLLTRRSVVWRTYNPLAAHEPNSGADGI